MGTKTRVGILESGRALADFAAHQRYRDPGHMGIFRRAFFSAFMRYKARCPYEDRVQNSAGKPTWSRSNIKAWHEGYNAGFAARELYDKAMNEKREQEGKVAPGGPAQGRGTRGTTAPLSRPS